METSTAVQTNGAKPQPEVPEASNDDRYSGQSVTAKVIELSSEPVDATVLDHVEVALHHHCHIKPEDAAIAALWVVHANIFNVFKATPRLVITAGMRGCGKTVMLNMLNRLVTNRFEMSNGSPALAYTLSQDGDKAFFLDEVDGWMRGLQKHDAFNWLQSGFNKSGMTMRLDMSTGREPREFSTHAAVAVAGIDLDNRLSDAVIERSHVIRLQRATKGEIPEPYDDRKHETTLDALGRRVLRFALSIKEQVAAYDYRGEYAMPEHLINRDRDRWEPLFAIASVAGVEWYGRVREIVENQPPVIDDSLGAQLLQAITRAIRRSNHKVTDAPSTRDLIESVCNEDGRDYNPFARYGVKNRGTDGRDPWINEREFCGLLKPYGLATSIHYVAGTKRKRGWNLAEVMDAQDRHAKFEQEVADELPG